MGSFGPRFVGQLGLLFSGSNTHRQSFELVLDQCHLIRFIVECTGLLYWTIGPKKDGCIKAIFIKIIPIKTQLWVRVLQALVNLLWL